MNRSQHLLEMARIYEEVYYCKLETSIVYTNRLEMLEEWKDAWQQAIEMISKGFKSDSRLPFFPKVS